jgi:cytochrome d ubiquinol oxidase subunit II
MMENLWFVILMGMLAAYVVLGGGDLGVGIMHLLIGRTAEERRDAIEALRPLWKPNEVWLVAAGGVLFLAFPAALATAFSGFYLPLMIVLWLMVFRSLGIELRYHIAEPLWARFWDTAMSMASLLLVLCLGAALGNVVRGVPIGADGTFFEPLWTDFRVGERTGILDWYTVTVGVFAVLALAHHGALWLAVFAPSRRQAARHWAARLWVPMLVAVLTVTLLSLRVQPAISEGLRQRPWGLVFPILAVAGLLAVLVLRRGQRDAAAWLASCGVLVCLLATSALAVFPNILPARDPQHALSIAAAATSAHGLTVALWWFVPGIMLVFGYFAFAATRMRKS